MKNRPKFNQLGNKVKLVVYTGQQREVFYNFGREQYLPETEIVVKMSQRILNEKKKFAFTRALFYNMAANSEIMRINGTN